MFEMLKSSAGLFFRGKLFAEPQKAYTQLALGILTGALIFIAARKIGLAAVHSAVIAGGVSGALQPFLFRNLRYR